ncbi:MAG: MFS transporter [Verrucomicrobia bacterium]|nr:MFS transporter [Verrucomicrobiota bacterium]
MSHAATSSVPPASAPPRKLSLGVIFLTLYIDLIGFSIIFPLGPDLLNHYLGLEGHSGVLGWLLAHLDSIAHALGKDSNFAAVLFGGVISSVFSILQFIFSPLWGGLGDRLGRRGVLRWTVAGTALGYLIWVVSGSFWLFLLSRLVSGAFSGNLSVATAAVADVTSRDERSKAMGLVGAAFGLGLVTGPTIGAFTSHLNLLQAHPGLAQYGVNPFTVPALIAFALCLVNLVWISLRFTETLSPATRAEAKEPRTKNPLRAILMLDNADVRRANVVAFIFSLAFVAMETSLTFLAAERFGYTSRQNGYLLGFLGLCAIVVQGWLVRKLLKRRNETGILSAGLVASAVGLVLIGFAMQPWLLYVGLAFLALGSGLVNPATTGLISLYASAAEQGRVLGIFRSLGSLSRAITPVLAGTVFWVFGGRTLFICAAILSVVALVLSTRLPKPVK